MDEPTKELVSSPQLEKMLLRHARKTPAEIEKITGIPRAEVAERLSNVLNTAHYRDDLVEEKLLLVELSDLIAGIKDRLREPNSTEDYVALVRVMTTNVKVMLDQIEKRRKGIDADLTRITSAQAQLMAQAISLAMERTILDLERMHMDTDPHLIRATFEKNLPAVITLLDAQVE